MGHTQDELDYLTFLLQNKCNFSSTRHILFTKLFELPKSLKLVKKTKKLFTVVISKTFNKVALDATTPKL